MFQLLLVEMGCNTDHYVIIFVVVENHFVPVSGNRLTWDFFDKFLAPNYEMRHRRISFQKDFWNESCRSKMWKMMLFSYKQDYLFCISSLVLIATEFLYSSVEGSSSYLKKTHNFTVAGPWLLPGSPNSTRTVLTELWTSLHMKRALELFPGNQWPWVMGRIWQWRGQRRGVV